MKRISRISGTAPRSIMRDNREDFFEMDSMYNDPSTFKARAQEELRRAKRYATFVSLISVDMSHANNLDEIQNFSGFDEFMKSLCKLIRNSIRETDLISGSDRQKIAILLIDTPREGASTLADRLRKILRYFMCDNIRSPLNWRVPIKEYYFPSPVGEEFSIQTFLEKSDKIPPI